MWGMGLSLSWKHFRNVIRFPKAILVGLFAQMVVLPVLAWVWPWPSSCPPPMQLV
ncbi:MAG: hypothetical protein EBQ67_06410 [Sphingobacteriia bacterium]|nr:hypothetical protein [Sphingobacteriia bacterium]